MSGVSPSKKSQVIPFLRKCDPPSVAVRILRLALYGYADVSIEAAANRCAVADDACEFLRRLDFFPTDWRNGDVLISLHDRALRMALGTRWRKYFKSRWVIVFAAVLLVTGQAVQGKQIVQKSSMGLP